MPYHVSPVPGIKVLEPRVSTHRTPYVYALENRVTALMFGAKKDDFDFIVDEQKGRPCLWECYPQAMEACYRGRECSVYRVGEEGFLRGMTGWEPELVCPNPVAVMGEERIDDLLAALLQAEREGALIIHRYEDTASYRARIAAHVVDRLVRFDLLDTRDERLWKHYGRIIDLLREAVSGECLEQASEQ